MTKTFQAQRGREKALRNLRSPLNILGAKISTLGARQGTGGLLFLPSRPRDAKKTWQILAGEGLNVPTQYVHLSTVVEKDGVGKDLRFDI
jgi:hypothetical protein